MTTSFNGNVNNPPPGSVYLERTRLHRVFEEAMDFPLVAVYAGSGYGKTRAVYSFLQQYEANITWLQITERDNIGARFWDNFTHMVAAKWPESEARLLEIGFPDTNEKFAMFVSMMEEADAIPGKHVMVYDDFHLLKNPALLGFFENAVKHLPPGSTVIIISRTMPEINMIGLMLLERIITIGEDTLCFTEDEIAEYFDLLSLHITSQDIRDIFDDTQGWAFALNLIGRSLINGDKYERYALDAMKANIFKLIEAEVFLKISEPLRRFLMRISLIDHLAATLIKTLAKDENYIKEMEQISAYIRYDSFLDAYVIHHLFLDYMRQHQHILTDDEKRETYNAAGHWCEENNYQTDALSYYEKSEDYDAIMRMVYSFDGQVPQDLASYTLDIFERLPESVFLKYPLFPSMHLKLMISLGMQEDATRLAEKYAEEYESQPESPEKNRALLGIYYAWGLLRLTICPSTKNYDFDVYFEKAGNYGKKSPFTEYGPSTNQSLGTYIVIVGDKKAGAPDAFIDAATRSVPHISSALNGNMYGFDDLARGELCLYRYELNDSETYLKRACEKARSKKQYDIQNRSLFYMMLVALFRGDLDTANNALEEIEKLLYEKDYVVRHTTYDVAHGYYHLALRQPERIPTWLKGDFSIYSHPALLENYANRAKAVYHLQTRKFNALLAFIEIERKRQTVLFGKIEFSILAALTLYQLNRKKEALAEFYQAYDLAGPNNIIGPFIKYGKEMRTLTASALKDESCPIPDAWLENLNRKSSAFSKRQSYMLSEFKAANNITGEITLTNREKEILRDLSQGLSRTEIAASQGISANTVKMVVNIIYEKLDVENLVEAVRKAADLKIV